MAITNAQQAKQVMNESRPMRKIKGQDHMLAYITPGERDTLVDLGGQETNQGLSPWLGQVALLCHLRHCSSETLSCDN